MKHYLIQKIGWEYNDEGYNRPESDGGTPEKIYLNKEKALQDCLALNYNEFKGCNIMDYSNCGCYEVFKDEYSFVDIYNRLFKAKIDRKDLEEYDFNLPQNMTLNQFKQLKPYINVNFYEVIEVEYDESEPAPKEPPKKESKNSILREEELTNTNNGRNAIWRGIFYSNLDVVTEWGKIGETLQSKEYIGAGEEFLDKKINEKLKKGYTYDHL